MKITIEISNALTKRARALAARENTTLQAVVEEGLRRLIEERSRRRFTLKPVTFKGEGLQPGVEEGSWARIRDLFYAARDRHPNVLDG